MKNNFFGSKLNSILLFMLIALMILVLFVMYKNKSTYFPVLQNKDEKILSLIGETPRIDSKQQVIGNKDDLVYFSVAPGAGLNYPAEAIGVVKGAYFFEGNIQVNILDSNKKLLRAGHGTATADWMTDGPVPFKTTIDVSNLPNAYAGYAYIEIHNDNPSGDPSKDKSILIPVFIL